MEEVNERTTPKVTVAFTDENGAPVVPNNAWYRIDDAFSETAMLAETAISPLASSVDIELTQSDTTILDENNEFEIRRITTRWKYWTGSRWKWDANEYFLKIKNLAGVTATSPV